MDTGAWPATVQGGLKESDTTEHTHTHIHTHTHSSSSTSGVQVCDALILPQPDKLSGLQESTYEKSCLIDGLLNIGSTCVTHSSPSSPFTWC